MLNLTFALAYLPLFTCVPQEHEDALPEPDAAITVRELKHHVGFLASDELRGRAAGTEDARRAARYLARALAQAGAAPAGDQGGYLQAMKLVSYSYAVPPTVRTGDGDDDGEVFQHGLSFSLRVRGQPRSTNALDVRHIASAEEIPSEPDASQALFFDMNSRKAGALLAESGNPSALGWGLVIIAGRGRGASEASTPRSRMTVELHPEGEAPRAASTLSATGNFLEGLRDWSISSVQLTLDAKRVERVDYNVIGRIAGVGTQDHPELAEECIVFSAHYDHIGVVGRAGGHGAGDEHEQSGSEAPDLIYNGADDDATGTAAVVELAQAFAAGPAPARTLIFLLAAGEEVGLLGTNYYLEHPAEPLAQTVANLNYEMIGRPDDLAGGFGKLWLTGFERTTLGQAYQDLELGVVPDPRLRQNYFQRSDNYAFAVRGIVAQTLSSYNSHSDYHAVSDELSTIDFEHMAASLADGFRAAQLLADGSLRPEWLPGGKP